MKSHRRRSHDQLANEMRVAFGRDSLWLFLSLEQFSSEDKLRQNANEVRFRLVAKWRKQMLERSFSLKKAKTSKNAVFATGASGGT